MMVSELSLLSKLHFSIFSTLKVLNRYSTCEHIFRALFLLFSTWTDENGGSGGEALRKNLKYHTLTLVENPMFPIAEMKICKICCKFIILNRNILGAHSLFSVVTHLSIQCFLLVLDLEHFATFLLEQIYGQRFSHVVSRF